MKDIIVVGRKIKINDIDIRIIFFLVNKYDFNNLGFYIIKCFFFKMYLFW